MHRIDAAISRPIHGLKLGPLDYFLALPGLMFGSYGMPVTILALAWLVSWRFALVCTIAAITTVAITGPLKHGIGRPRPDAPPTPRAFALRGLVNNPAFPSGDSAQAGMIVAMLIFAGPYTGWQAWSALPLLPLCMFSRVYYGAHWVGDTLAGAAIGLAVGLAYGYWFGAWMAA